MYRTFKYSILTIIICSGCLISLAYGASNVQQLSDYELLKLNYNEHGASPLQAWQVKDIPSTGMRDYDKTNYVNLPQIELYEVRGPKALCPVPQSGSRFAGSSKITLKWTPGLGAVKHIVHIGTSPENQDVAVTAIANTVVAKGLYRNQVYFWRIDEVQKNGTIVKGDLWNFELLGSCLGHWPLDEHKGVIAADVTGKRNGIVAGTPLWKPDQGKFGGCIELNGQDNHIEIPPLNIVTNNITFTAWVNVETSNSLAVILFHRNEDLSSCGLNFYFSHELRHHWCPIGGWDIPSELFVPTGKWIFVAACIDSENTVLHVFDGRNYSTATISYSRPPLYLSEPFYIGRDTNWDSRTFKGMIDDVRIYDYTLTETEIQEVIENQIPRTVGVGILDKLREQ